MSVRSDRYYAACKKVIDKRSLDTEGVKNFSRHEDWSASIELLETFNRFVHVGTLKGEYGNVEYHFGADGFTKTFINKTRESQEVVLPLDKDENIYEIANAFHTSHPGRYLFLGFIFAELDKIAEGR